MKTPRRNRPTRAKEPGSVARSRGKTLTTFGVGGLPIVNHFLQRVQLDGLLREVLKDDKRCKISPAVGALILVRNYLLSRQPLYGVSEWAQQVLPELLQLEREQVSSVNDDRVARSLDQLFDADCPALVLRLTHHVVKEFDLDLAELHNDSTTVSFFGEYRDAGEGKRVRGKKTPAVTFGHNKDHRPDLKQLLYHLTVSADGTVPVAFGVESGNVTDDQTHRETWDLLCKITGRTDFMYVADSKLATRENMSYIANRGGRFISVLPRTRKEDGEFRERVIRDEISWREVHRKVSDQGYVQDIISAASEASLASEGYRLIWFHSTRKAELDLARRSTAVRKAMQALNALALKLLSPRTRYRDEAKIIGEVERILTQHGVKECFEYQVTPEDQEDFVQDGKGRPGPTTRYRREVKKRFRLYFVAGEKHLAEEARHDGVFPLVTNDRQLSDTDVYHAYKRQAYIEKRFSQLKTQFQLTPVFLKSTQRLVALLTVYYFALLIQALIERELRRAMRKAGLEAIPAYPEDRECKAPSTRRTLELFDNVDRHELTTTTSITIFATELSESQRLVLQLLDIPKANYDA